MGMCVNQYWIRNKYTDRDILVKCGVCKACQQEKANYRTSRIRREIRTYPNFQYFFITLHYENRFLPFVKVSDPVITVDNSCNITDDTISKFSHFVKVYRQSIVTRFYNRHTKRYHKIIRNSDTGHCIDMLSVPSSTCDFSGCNKPVKHTVNGSVAICYSKDIQNFFKRLRINLKRYYNYNGNIRYFQTSEYGPSSQRPHFHLLLELETDRQISPSFDQLKRAVATSWPFCNVYKFKRSFERAYNPAKYISQYINCGSSISEILKTRSFRPKSSHSLYYGVDFNRYKFDYLQKKIFTRDMDEDYTLLFKGQPVRYTMRIPKYVTNYYFPYVKGLFRLSNAKVFDILVNPWHISWYGEELKYTKDDYRTFFNIISRCYYRIGIRYGRKNISRIRDWADCYIRLRELSYSDYLKQSYSDVFSLDDVSFVQHFVNIPQAMDYDYPVLGYLFNDMFSFSDDDLDYNKVPRVVIPTAKLEEDYESNQKQRHINDYTNNIEELLFYY
ncbi:replication initiator protein [Dipodfec virus RodF1_12]|uniref:Replication initiator protein n=1 Tax=Dipodfec virus RodF1_12 TaxID=2929289 RepID=A0A976R8F3_9VIRU|nr:replication initiator protein [Dipodfec virus RodF1_12]